MSDESQAHTEPDAVLEAEGPEEDAEFEVAIAGLSMPEEARSGLEEEIRRAADHVLARERQRVPPTNVVSERPMKRARRHDEGPPGPTVSAAGLGIDPEPTRELEQEIVSTVREFLSRQSPGAAAGEAAVSLFATPPGKMLSLDPLFKITIPKPWVIALYPNSRDAIRMVVADAPIGDTRCDIALQREVDWDKELGIWHSSLGIIARWRFPKKPNLVTVSARTTDTHTLVFRKPGFLGIWHDLSHFEPARFWRAFGGTHLTFNWRFD